MNFLIILGGVLALFAICAFCVRLGVAITVAQANQMIRDGRLVVR